MHTFLALRKLAWGLPTDPAGEATVGDFVARLPLDPPGRDVMERSECEPQLRWIVGRGIDDGVWDRATVSKNRDGLLEVAITARFPESLREETRVKGLLSNDHSSVDGTLIEARASMKSFKPLFGRMSGDLDDDGSGDGDAARAFPLPLSPASTSNPAV